MMSLLLLLEITPAVSCGDMILVLIEIESLMSLRTYGLFSVGLTKPQKQNEKKVAAARLSSRKCVIFVMKALFIQ